MRINIHYPTKNLYTLSTSGNRQLQVEQWKKREELEATVRSTYWAVILQNSDSDDIVASTIMATADTDKPHPQLNCI